MVTRDDVLKLIRFHSAQNDGRGVSMDKFAELTGIKRHEWQGKLWARWNDALSEAGYGPNVFGSESFDPDVLIHLLGDLTLELDAFPSHNDINFRHHQVPTFPRADAFAKHIGTADKRAQALAQLALDEPRYAAVYDIVAPRLRTPKRSEAAAPSPPSSYPGRVYLIKSGDFYKIGKTDNPTRRYTEIQLAVPGNVEEVHVLETDDPSGIELYWHRRFAGKRRAGEWFALTDADVAAFKLRGSFM